MKKKKISQKKSSSKKEKKQEEPLSEDRDFGGFPDRDLKKNLGCG